MTRFFDIFLSLLGLLVLSPILALLAFWILLDSKGGVFFKQTRVGKHGKHFQLLKLRSMRIDAEKSGQLTVGARDPRITNSGLFIRKYKLDEMPQLINVLKGEMSLVGPRPEVPKYVALYNEKQLRVLNVKPGITDLASLAYFHENELLAASENPEQTYIDEVMPAKLELNLAYINNPSLAAYFSVVFKTIAKILK
ncbi:MAG: sugar transferase [Salibacteraceae bacterium]|nr:sugar transferase [Salibacteraceae bacterium]MDP4687935.1 sugar transferase [Salibacteraceae bacterium]